MGFYKQLIQFLDQAKTDNLKSKHFDSKYLNTDVKVSFGQGNTARIPWISFLIKPNTTSNGIYPVYLFYKDFSLLILAYGVSEPNHPIYNWNIKKSQSIKEYFKINFDKKPDRYGASFIYKVYNVNELPSEEIMNQDLKSIIQEYMENEHNGQLPKNFDSVLDNFIKTISKSGLKYSKGLITRFTASLLTKPFVILTGLSGSGKTKLAQAFVQWITVDDEQYRIIPVGADWTNRDPLLGYPNALLADDYKKPENGVLDLLIRANENPDLPYFLVLDEMNLSHVERYFADFLSVMESGKEISLHASEDKLNGVPSKIKVPANFFIIGTVNIDETTHMFSPKVLDRANTIEFRISEDEMINYFKQVGNVDLDALTSKGSDMASDFLKLSTVKINGNEKVETVSAILLVFFSELKKTGAEFGYRTASEILRLIHQLGELDDNLTLDSKIDIAIMQKLLPKLHGSRRKLSPVLIKLGGFCVNSEINVEKQVFEKEDFNYKTSGIKYPLSLEKITRMYKGAVDNGFTSFAEA